MWKSILYEHPRAANYDDVWNYVCACAYIYFEFPLRHVDVDNKNPIKHERYSCKSLWLLQAWLWLYV